jgi:PTH1 family peptidyl-tRNA hydrolase
MKTIIALGNIGEEYKNIRHNVAWIICDELINKDSWQENKYVPADLASTRIESEDILFVKPHTFMNKSGDTLPYLQKTYGTKLEDLIVIHDDIDLPISTIKISYDRGDGGHNGVKSIMGATGSKEFTRIRVGVSITDETGTLRKPDVLGDFSKEDLKTIKETLAPRVGKIISTLATSGLQKAMSLYN